VTKHLKVVLVVSGVLLISGGASAGAASLISGSQIKKNSIPLNRLSKGTQNKINGVSGQSVVPGSRGPAGLNGENGANGVNGAKGETGATGAKGDTGADGAKGDKGDTGTVEYVGEKWGQIDRNTIGSPVAQLRSGPFSAGGVEPPLGVGSLGFNVKDSTEKVAFGNQVDFSGDKISDITDIGFSVFWTGEDRSRNANNMPNITFEVDPTGPSAAAPNYSSLVFVPNGPANVNAWTAIDATDAAAGWWYFTNGTTATAVGCGQSGPLCSFEDLQANIANTAGYEDMAVSLSFGVSKGRDHEFQGAVDALRYNDEVYDFEPFGVTRAP
jgi:hypothetical protein